LTAFCYVDPRVFSERRFRSFLERHARLWERLGAFQVTYVTDRRWNGRAAETAFGRFTEAHWPRSVRSQPSIRERILKAFRLERSLRLGRIYRLQEDEAALFRALKQQLTPARYDALYDIWAQTSDQLVYDLVAPEPHEQWPKGALDARLIRTNYRWLYPA